MKPLLVAGILLITLHTDAQIDPNQKVILYINDQLMGGSIRAEEESEFRIQVLIEDEPDTDYEINLYAGDIEPELSTQATDWKASDGLIETISVTGNGIHVISGIFSGKKPEFLNVRIEQDGTDKAWSAPVWVNDRQQVSEEPGFFWTANPSSRVYHIPGCSAIDRIKPANLVSGSNPPAAGHRMRV